MSSPIQYMMLMVPVSVHLSITKRAKLINDGNSEELIVGFLLYYVVSATDVKKNLMRQLFKSPQNFLMEGNGNHGYVSQG